MGRKRIYTTEEAKQRNREKSLAYYYAHKEKRLKEIVEWQKKNPEKLKKYMRNYYTKNNEEYERHLVRGKVYRALKKGVIVKSPCENCGAENAEAHHCDYNKPLEITWLCRKCHNDWHKNNISIS